MGRGGLALLAASVFLLCLWQAGPWAAGGEHAAAPAEWGARFSARSAHGEPQRHAAAASEPRAAEAPPRPPAAPIQPAAPLAGPRDAQRNRAQRPLAAQMAGLGMRMFSSKNRGSGVTLRFDPISNSMVTTHDAYDRALSGAERPQPLPQLLPNGSCPRPPPKKVREGKTSKKIPGAAGGPLLTMPLAPDKSRLAPAVAQRPPCAMRPGSDCCGGASLSEGRLLYDAFTFGGDWDQLQVRLGTLSPWVDTFILLQSNMTFAGSPKPVATHDSPELAPWRRCTRIITLYSQGRWCAVEAVTVDGATGETRKRILSDPWPGGGGWRDEVEFWLREQWHYGLYDVNDSDVVMFSDLDEIPDPLAVVAVLEDKQEENQPWFVMQHLEYAYGFTHLRRGLNPQESKEYFGRAKTTVRLSARNDTNYTHTATSVVRGHMARRMRPSAIYLRGRNRLAPCATDKATARLYRRSKPGYWGSDESLQQYPCFFLVSHHFPRPVGPAAGWHCNNCFRTAAQMLRKLCSFGWMLDLLYSRGFGPQDVLELMRSGRNVHSTSRRSTDYLAVDSRVAAPPFVVHHRERFAYLLDPARITQGTFKGCPVSSADRVLRNGTAPAEPAPRPRRTPAPPDFDGLSAG
eukprot:TRINITY_DN18536_c0_g1_i1.p1 TRINITY_DN18536_c0_g1~~TRINITY_DN18536_c0_g1_i1.p1  ORF type:complete len:658 (+),score=192.28 TRINITY_DN18536_c0_g1_i1:87-1976(+)